MSSHLTHGHHSFRAYEVPGTVLSAPHRLTQQPRQQPYAVGAIIRVLQKKDPDVERVACRRLHSSGGAAGGPELELEKGASSCVQKSRDGFWGDGARDRTPALPFICFALLSFSFSTRKMGMRIVPTSWCYGWIKCVAVQKTLREGVGT